MNHSSNVRYLLSILLTAMTPFAALCLPSAVATTTGPNRTTESIHSFNSVQVSSPFKDKGAQALSKAFKKNAEAYEANKKFGREGFNSILMGPGRSGGGNFTYTPDEPGQILDDKEATSKVLVSDFIKQWPGFADFLSILDRMSQISPQLSDYLLEAYTSKSWFFVNQSLNINKNCVNLSFLQINSKQLATGACQYLGVGFVSELMLFNTDLKKLQKEKRQRSLVILLIHEGLVHQMLKVLKSFEGKESEEQIAARQHQMEMKLREISVRIFSESYTDLSELRTDLLSAGLPMLYSEKELDEMHNIGNAQKIFRAKDYYIGAREKTEMMSRVFQKATAFQPEDLRKKFGSEICFSTKSGYSTPGYWTGAYIHLDPIIPEVLFTAQVVREDLSLPANFDIFKSLKEIVPLVPMSGVNEHWIGQFSISVEAMLNLLEAQAGGNADVMKGFKKYLEYQKTIGNERVINIELRQASPEILIVKRTTLVRDKNGNLSDIDSDYGMGEVSSYPECLKKN